VLVLRVLVLVLVLLPRISAEKSLTMSVQLAASTKSDGLKGRLVAV
jgi:hypothetical protein